MEAWVESEPFQKVMNACRTNDRNTLDRIVEERLASAQGPERAFWLRIRAKQLSRDALFPHVMEVAWADLEEARCAAQDDPEGHLETLSDAFTLSLRGERVDRLFSVLRAIRLAYGKLDGVPFFWQDLGNLNMKRGRWQKATRAFTRAVAAFGRLTAREQGTFACRLAHYHAWRAICQVACNNGAAAAADLETALALSANEPEQNISHLTMGMARAELALHRGFPQEARAALQHGVMQDALLKRPKATPAQMADTELLAARIARAEGNQVGFAHFCEKALALCEKYSLPLTESRVRAVMAGASR